VSSSKETPRFQKLQENNFDDGYQSGGLDERQAKAPDHPVSSEGNSFNKLNQQQRRGINQPVGNNKPRARNKYPSKRCLLRVFNSPQATQEKKVKKNPKATFEQQQNIYCFLRDAACQPKQLSTDLLTNVLNNKSSNNTGTNKIQNKWTKQY